jgi:hypothetical protein
MLTKSYANTPIMENENFGMLLTCPAQELAIPRCLLKESCTADLQKIFNKVHLRINFRGFRLMQEH